MKLSFKHEILSMDGYSPEYVKENQDYSKVYHFITPDKETNRLFLLADGHGPEGHTASQTSIGLICELIEKKFMDRGENELSDEVIKLLLLETFEDIQRKLKIDPDNSFKHSGTTMVVALVRKNVLYFASVGDSKGFLASKSGTVVAPTLETREHKPELADEKARIIETGGIVAPYFDANNEPNGPHRVWNQKRTEPGLATSRTLGDILGHELGVSHVPEILIKKLDTLDRFIFLASDGVWDHLNTKDVIDRCSSFLPTLNAECAVKKIISDAADKWKSEGQRDDITVLLAFIRQG